MKKNSVIKKTSKTVTDGTEQLLHQLKNGLSKIGELGTAARNKFVDYVREVFDVLPLIEKAGFRTNRLIVGVSIPPSVEVHFTRFKAVSEEEIDELMGQYGDKTMFKLILKSLMMANEFQGKLSSDNFIFSETCIEISIPPKISIKYLNKEIANFKKIEAEFD